MKHLRWSAVGLCVMALAACDSTPVDPAATGTGPASSGPAGGMAVTAPVFSAVPVLDETGGHLYDAVASADGINWADARTAAQDMTSGDCRADLAPVTSAEENAFILENFPGVAPPIGNGYWFGGFQHPEAEAPDAGWTWVSGEEFDFGTGRMGSRMTCLAPRMPFTSWTSARASLSRRSGTTSTRPT